MDHVKLSPVSTEELVHQQQLILNVHVSQATLGKDVKTVSTIKHFPIGYLIQPKLCLCVNYRFNYPRSSWKNKTATHQGRPIREAKRTHTFTRVVSYEIPCVRDSMGQQASEQQ